MGAALRLNCDALVTGDRVPKGDCCHGRQRGTRRDTDQTWVGERIAEQALHDGARHR